MYHRSLYEIVMETGRVIGLLTKEMQSEGELFDSPLTLRAVEAQLLIMAHTLGNVTPVLHRRLLQVDWVAGPRYTRNCATVFSRGTRKSGTPSMGWFRRHWICCRHCGALSRCGSSRVLKDVRIRT